MNDTLLAELAVLYRDVDDALAGWSCPASTECCRFAITGREPYVTSIELAGLERAIASLGGRRALAAVTVDHPPGVRRRRALSVRREPDAERRCPLLTGAGRCAVYASRPLGCRTFFCDRASAGEPLRQQSVNALVRRVQELAARHEAGGDRGRPLTRALDRSR